MHKEDVYRDLKQKILSEELAPGEWLVERNISQTYQISRTPVREILRRLVTDGLLSLEPSKGCLVRRLNLEEIIEIFQAREAIEGTAVRLSCLRGDQAFFSKIIELKEKFETYDISWDSSLGVIAGNELHDAIVEAANNALLGEFYQKSRNLLSLIRNITKKSVDIEKSSQADHLAITKAILSRDDVESEKCMREHLSSTCHLLVKSLLIDQAGLLDRSAIWKLQLARAKD